MLPTAVEHPPWLLRISRAAGEAPVGAGLLLDERHVLTCAHVVTGDQGRTAPVDPVHVEFQHVEHRGPILASVVNGGWYPEQEDGTGDVAVLELHGHPPTAALPAPLRSTQSGIWDHRFRTYGYPVGHERAGVPSRGVVIGAAGAEWIQLQSESTAGYTLEAGFSGSPVWDINLGAVIGIVVTRDRPRGGSGDPRTGYAIPAEVLQRYWPRLRLTAGPAGPQRSSTTHQEHIEKLIQKNEQNAQNLEVQAAMYAGTPPLHMINQLEYLRAELAELRQRLESER